MSLRYACLASGSSGNCHAVTDEDRILLVDAGLSLLQIRTRLSSLGWDPGRIAGVALTHEHADHIQALPVLLRRTDWPILTTDETRRALQAMGHDLPETRWIPLHAGRTSAWEGWQLLPFSIPHDAADPVAFRIEARDWTLSLVTDLGHPTALVMDHCRAVDLLVLEANHDLQMLREGPYPPHLKARILSRVGHLSNAAMAETLANVASPRLRAVVLAHLSERNNLPELARFAALEALRGTTTSLTVAAQRFAVVPPL